MRSRSHDCLLLAVFLLHGCGHGAPAQRTDVARPAAAASEEPARSAPAPEPEPETDAAPVEEPAPTPAAAPSARQVLSTMRDKLRTWAGDDAPALSAVSTDAVPEDAPIEQLLGSFHDGMARQVLPLVIDASRVPPLSEYALRLRSQAVGHGYSMEILQDFGLAGEGIFEDFCECFDERNEARMDSCKESRKAACERGRAAVAACDMVARGLDPAPMVWVGAPAMGAAPATPAMEFVALLDKATEAGLERSGLVRAMANVLSGMVAATQLPQWRPAADGVAPDLHAFVWGIEQWAAQGDSPVGATQVDLAGSGRADPTAIAGELFDGFLEELLPLAWDRLGYGDARRVANDLRRLHRLRAEGSEFVLPGGVAERIGRVIGEEGSECAAERDASRGRRCAEVRLLTAMALEAQVEGEALGRFAVEALARAERAGVPRGTLARAAWRLVESAKKAGEDAAAEATDPAPAE